MAAQLPVDTPGAGDPVVGLVHVLDLLDQERVTPVTGGGRRRFRP
jgi:hypothetical protein